MAMIEPPRPAVFLDQEGALVDSIACEGDPSRFALLPGVLLGAVALSIAGYRLFVVSNRQRTVREVTGRVALASVESRIAELFAAVGAQIDGFYRCPHGRPRRGQAACDCRRPKPGLLLCAAATHGVDLARSWMIGDMLDDVEAGHRAGCRAILIDRGSETCWQRGDRRTPDVIVARFDDAVRVIFDADERTASLQSLFAQTVH